MDRRRVGLTLVLLLLADSANGQACGGMLTAPGTATSPNYPNDYNTDETCEWTINVPEGSLVLLTFDSFETDDDYDFLYIYNGGSDTAPLLQSFSGDTIPGPITGTTNQMFLRFTSDGSGTYPGFQFSYTATDTQVCGGILSAPPGGTVTSPNYPSNYPNSAICLWTITVPEGSLVLLTFHSFETDEDYDFLYIYDGGSDSALLLNSFTGATIPDPLTSITNQMLLLFTSDGDDTYPGFQASYTAADTPVCGGILSAPHGGTVATPNYSGNYPNYATCHWTITVPEGSIVLLTFDSFETDSDSDFLYIYDGGRYSRLRPWSFSGEKKFIPDPIISTSNQMLLLFTSDYYDTYPGFQASYTAAVDRCADGSHNCAPQETCYNTADSFTCAVCQDPLGMQSGAIPDGSITASSTYDSDTVPYLARLYGRGGWESEDSNLGDWLQVDLGEIKKVTGTITQGVSSGEYWVKSYKLQHSTDGASWTTYANSEGTEKVFIGNTDYYTPVTNLLDNAVEARYVRFLPQTWESYMSMRAEILGCNLRVDECAGGTNNCSPQATCSDTPESFTCTCNPGYIGNGVTCTGKGIFYLLLSVCCQALWHIRTDN
ncbi:CUB domain-containing protein 2-like isoform X2 [Branchiostoma floridae]|nr:CUB domain-containing protein 2-like isoform X2 [Branchiostoma floridae]XP_035689933.1 CUB domain-containing protein 2-like isoform X2 [Branchiostoma floridae]XP_035689935.1 CUB domain-containing protein 2-like isoform X2 [Branchiostoma floridae]XP_035689936.1 CUB domain-containing protein 2-like isoform X2 [Branchiostoma floridae]XP_035689937.1 CUB domain-containing protein 2-like isoform X2 [Branchiostoma floridae]XP_035689938.1 CUB domain-containing protein 2-like isoform X2 [Branchiosto